MKALGLDGTFSTQMERILKYSGSKRLRASIFLRNLTAFLYGTTPEQVHCVRKEAESHKKISKQSHD